MPIYIGDINRPVPIPSFTESTGNLGDKEYIPWDIRQFRYSVESWFKRFGTPVLIKRRYTDLDVRSGVAFKAPDRDPIFAQARYASFSLSTGYASTQLSPNEYYTVSGTIVTSALNPGAGYIQAPMYRGFGPGVETYIIELDKARDFFSFQPGGAMMNVEQGGVVAPWYPKIFDGDLIVEVMRDKGGNIVDVNQVWEASRTTPITMRGRDKLGQIETQTYGYDNTANRYVIQQQMDTALLPALDIRVTQLQYDR